ncbi:carbonic anhydrase [Phycomyces blakesleeanus]
MCLMDENMMATGDDEGVVKNGTQVVAGSQSGALYLWQWGEWKTKTPPSGPDRWVGHPSSIDSQCKLDEETICTGGSDGILRLVTIVPKRRFEGVLGDHGEDFPVERVRMTAQQDFLGSCGHDLQLRFWDVGFLFEQETIDQTENRSPVSATATVNKFNPLDVNLDGLLDNNRRWAAAVEQEDPDFFKHIAVKQEPKILWIGCSDSRAPANQIVQLGPGEIFEHRNIANVVNHSDLNCLSVLQYAVEVLKVEHIIVCGHYNCGGVTAAYGHHQYGLIDNWLRNIKDVYRLHRKELEEIKDETLRLRQLIEFNAISSAENVCHSTIVQNAWSKGQKLTVHAWAYDLESGIAKKLNWCRSHIQDVNNIYMAA